MEREIITIENGIVTVPANVRMNFGEIADLFDIFYQTVKRNIRAIEKSGVASGDESMGGTVEGMNIYPDYYGLEMIIAIAFRIQSRNTKLFRKWVIKRVVNQDIMAVLIQPSQNVWLN